MTIGDRLCGLLKAWDMELGAEEAERFNAYYALLRERGSEMNLTADLDEGDMAERSFMDSLSLIKMGLSGGANLIDIGSGAGFPGIPVRIMLPDLKLTLLDANGKRVSFLNELTTRLGLEDVKVIHRRAEEAAHDAELRESYDYATSRAVAKMNVLCELCLPFVRPGGEFLAMKTQRAEEEINSASRAVSMLGGRLKKPYSYTLPSGGGYVIVRALKEAPSAARFPRKYPQIVKNPL